MESFSGTADPLICKDWELLKQDSISNWRESRYGYSGDAGIWRFSI